MHSTSDGGTGVQHNSPAGLFKFLKCVPSCQLAKVE